MSEPIDLPVDTPVMTLPNTALFPQALLPLYIFEPRYREMLADALNTNRMFAVAGLDPVRAEEPDQIEPLYPVAGLGVIRACHENADGTSNLVLQGVARVRCRRILNEEPYRRCAIEVLATEPGAVVAELRRQRLALLHQLGEWRELGGPVSTDAMRFLRSLREPEGLFGFGRFHTLPGYPGKTTAVGGTGYRGAVFAVSAPPAGGVRAIEAGAQITGPAEGRGCVEELGTGQRDRGTEGQRDRGTEGQRDRRTEGQRELGGEQKA